VRHRICCSAQ